MLGNGCGNHKSLPRAHTDYDGSDSPGRNPADDIPDYDDMGLSDPTLPIEVHGKRG